MTMTDLPRDPAPLRPLVPPGATMAQLALRWILMFDAVTCTIPGAKRPSQAEDNVGAAIMGDYLKLKEGDEVRRTGRLLEVPVGTVMSRLHRARERLRELMSDAPASARVVPLHLVKR